ncbi:MAG: hypothetical protein HN353_08535 [Bdellovibrionales bacterium]|jgi:hypothetical protein|nr:hypothetical protein [Bdellovibrionales bacterium]MBT3526869.1 hypothetical protein [Bdellovibrionales bacterium]MBT7669539.1 hypothetical protein [Bdellovibrionales bacterium]MBT7765794.1 hypothetical protein [Bdellovibrionales bacterium]
MNLLLDVLFWCMIINLGLLLWWFLIVVLAHDFVYQMHSRWFKLSVEKFDSIHYAGMAYFKLLVFVFFVVPYIAFKISL